MFSICFISPAADQELKARTEVDGLRTEEVTTIQKTARVCHLQEAIKGHNISGKLLPITVTIVVKEDIWPSIAHERGNNILHRNLLLPLTAVGLHHQMQETVNRIR
ncbi:hypothetical protein QQF64_000903 [Cirrhinus molitorella]|uniref:Uncharacterized protein n=1 Tax=Cirrhinus molitorella TaxID=172907 RepID=A0ABR3P028_9TELE